MFKALGVGQKWTALHVVVLDDGKMKLFEDEAASKVMASFDLTLWSTDNVLCTETDYASKITLQSDEGSIQFAFDSAAESKEVMEWMKRFIADEEEEEAVERGQNEEKQGDAAGAEGMSFVSMMRVHDGDSQ